MKPDLTEQYGEEKAHRIAYLIAGYLRQTLSEKEHDELDKWVIASDDNQRLFEELIDRGKLEQGIKEIEGVNVDSALEKIKKQIPFQTERKSGKAKRLLAYGIAASVIITAGIIMIFQLNFGKNRTTEFPKQVELLPGGNEATLTLASGRILNLGEVRNGLLDSASDHEVLKTAEGQLSYESDKIGGNSGYHILATPPGGQYQVTLPDKTRVWLNAASSLKYPVIFDEEKRVVELKGEAYFEVSSSKTMSLASGYSGGEEKQKPFIVKVNGMEVTVLGTQFNINAYEDEAAINTTLFEGKVRVSWQVTGSDQRIHTRTAELQDIGQVQADRKELRTIDPGKINADEVIAWKDGMFRFKDQPIENILRQVARWYNAEILYQGKKPDFHFNATIYRKEPVSKLLLLLEETNRVHFKIEGRKILVSE